MRGGMGKSLDTDFERRLERYLAFNARRIEQATAVMDRGTRNIFELLPVFLHYNDPRIPGFREGPIPHGIDNFSPNERQSRWLEKLGIDPLIPASSENEIYAVYVMGSTSSIGQGRSSDLDVWVCVRAGMSAERHRALQEKCLLITAYCKALGSEVNLFITPEDRFISGAHGTLDTEDCGSAQSLFLLDEFYRSSIRLAGRIIAWYLILPEEEHADYAGVVERLRQSGCLKENQWFDFGSVVRSSPAEYFGSGLWLLYKGIDSPYKAALKITLMEAYSFGYPAGDLVSTEFKRNLHASRPSMLHQDAYCLMFRKVSDYLKHQGEIGRLKLMQMCFYMKGFDALQDTPEGEIRKVRGRFLGLLKKQWCWSRADVDFAENTGQRTAASVMKFEQELFASFIKSYRALLSFSISHGIEYAITSDDAGVLSRKLYANYDNYEGKILPVTRGVKTDLTQDNLTFVSTGPDSLCRQGWHIYPSCSSNYELLHLREIYFGQSLTECVLWTVYNRLCDLQTRIRCHGADTRGKDLKIRRLATFMQEFFENNSLTPQQKDLQQMRRILDCAVVLNFEQDATADGTLDNLEVVEGSALSCGHEHRCLVGSVHALTVNSWGEVNCHAFTPGAHGVVELFAYLLRQNMKNGGGLDFLRHIHICSCSDHHAEMIRYDLEEQLREIFWCVTDADAEYTFEIGGETYTARSSDEYGVSIVCHSMFGAMNLDVTILSRFGMRPEYALQVPPEVENCASVGIRQYFFAPRSVIGMWDIYAADESNEISIFRGYRGSRAELVNAINRFYTRQVEDSRHGSMSFNLPQYFVLGRNGQPPHPFTIRE